MCAFDLTGFRGGTAAAGGVAATAGAAVSGVAGPGENADEGEEAFVVFRFCSDDDEAELVELANAR